MLAADAVQERSTMSRNTRLALLLLFVALLTVAGQVSFGQAPADAALDSGKVDAEIVALIKQLGAEEFDSREVAQAKLERYGTRAFDDLLLAQHSDDLEIATRAKFLVKGLQVRWADETDPLEVRATLRNYGEASRTDRKSLLERLTWLEHGKGGPALARLARFETDPSLAKAAALLVMHMGKDLSPADRERLSQSIKTVTGQSRRDTAQWLRAYARSLNEPETAVAEWNRLCEGEFVAYMRQPGDDAMREILRDLLRWQAEMLLDLKRTDEVLAVDTRLTGLVDLDGPDILEHTDWLVKTGQWQVVVDTLAKFEAITNEQPLLMYRLAEAKKSLGQKEEADQIAKAALELKADEWQLHDVAAQELQRRGLFDWAETEYRELIKRMQAINPRDEMLICSRLAEMLHDQLKDEAAGTALKEWFDRYDGSPAARIARDEVVASRRSRMHYFFSVAFREKQDYVKEAEELDKAAAADEHDVDVLIGLYRLKDAKEDRRAQTRELIDGANEHFREQIQEYSEALADARRQPGFEQQAGRLAVAVAMFNNQLAWLIANTEGNAAEALAMSKRSLELRPNEAAYLDTLGRCYYAVGDLENAIRTQREAIKAEPFSGQMTRQLKMFEDALEKKKQEQGKQ
jgi:tetratricopeptide (TPR) repeat protein